MKLLDETRLQNTLRISNREDLINYLVQVVIYTVYVIIITYLLIFPHIQI